MTKRKRHSPRPRIPRVAGESAREILNLAAERFELRAGDDGMTHFEFDAPVDEIAPLVRAIMRVEAELLVAEAAVVGTPAERWRTPDQRRCDAFMTLIVRASDALSRVGLGV